MEDPGAVRIDAGVPSPPRRRWLLPAVVMIVVVIGGLAGLGAFSGSATTDTTIPELEPGPLERGRATVEDFAGAWNRGSAAEVTGLIGAEDPGSIVLPGLLYPRFGPPLERSGLREAMEFVTGVTRLSLGSCTSVPAPAGSELEVIVRCEDGVFEGAYAEAMRSTTDARETGVTFGLRDDRIVEISAAGGAFGPLPYCIWTGRELPEEAPSLFDLHCDPITTAANGQAHAAAATAFVAAGAPLPSPEMVDARLVASFVDRFVDRHNAGSALGGMVWLGPGVRVQDLPGFAGADVEIPDLQDFLEWSTRLLQIDLGDCPVDIGGPVTTVTCPGLTVDGPMLGEPHSQPTRFVLTASMSRQATIQPFDVILAVEPLAEDRLPLGPVCRRIQRLAPESASLAFTSDCGPIYSVEAAEVLAAAIG